MSIYNLKGLYVIFKLKVIHKAYYVYYVCRRNGDVLCSDCIHAWHSWLLQTGAHSFVLLMDSFQVYENKSVCRKM